MPTAHERFVRKPTEGENNVRKAKRWARLALVLGTIALLVLPLAVSACGSSGSDATGSLKTYSNGEYKYSFQYPDTWKLVENSSPDVSAGGSAAASLGVYDPKGAVAQDTYIDMALVSVYRLNANVDASMMPQIKGEVETVLSSLSSQAGDLKTVEELAETSVNGMSGYKVTFSFNKNDVPAISTLYFLFSGNMEYQVTVQAAEKNWEKLKPVFAAMIASFKPSAN
jgi:hypothetical protein